MAEYFAFSFLFRAQEFVALFFVSLKFVNNWQDERIDDLRWQKKQGILELEKVF